MSSSDSERRFALYHAKASPSVSSTDNQIAVVADCRGVPHDEYREITETEMATIEHACNGASAEPSAAKASKDRNGGWVRDNTFAVKDRRNSVELPVVPKGHQTSRVRDRYLRCPNPYQASKSRIQAGPARIQITTQKDSSVSRPLRGRSGASIIDMVELDMLTTPTTWTPLDEVKELVELQGVQGGIPSLQVLREITRSLQEMTLSASNVASKLRTKLVMPGTFPTNTENIVDQDPYGLIIKPDPTQFPERPAWANAWRLKPKSKTLFSRLPVELLELCLSDVLECVGKTPALVVALRGTDVYYIVLELFYRTATYSLRLSNNWMIQPEKAQFHIRNVQVHMEEHSTVAITPPQKHISSILAQVPNLTAIHFTMSDYLHTHPRTVEYWAQIQSDSNQNRARWLGPFSRYIELGLRQKITLITFTVPSLLTPATQNGDVAKILFEVALEGFVFWWNMTLGVAGKLETVHTGRRIFDGPQRWAIFRKWQDTRVVWDTKEVWFWKAPKGEYLLDLWLSSSQPEEIDDA